MGFGATRGRLYMKHPDLFKVGHCDNLCLCQALHSFVNSLAL